MTATAITAPHSIRRVRNIGVAQVRKPRANNDWRPHRSLGQRAPCAPRAGASHRSAQAREIIAIPVLGGLHHVYHQAVDDVPDLILAPTGIRLVTMISIAEAP